MPKLPKLPKVALKQGIYLPSWGVEIRKASERLVDEFIEQALK